MSPALPWGPKFQLGSDYLHDSASSLALTATPLHKHPNRPGGSIVATARVSLPDGFPLCAVDIRVTILCGGRCPMLCGIFRSRPGLHPALMTNNVFKHCQMSPKGQRCPSLKIATRAQSPFLEPILPRLSLHRTGAQTQGLTMTAFGSLPGFCPLNPHHYGLPELTLLPSNKKKLAWGFLGGSVG